MKHKGEGDWMSRFLEMHIGTTLCMALGVFTFLLALFFFIGKGKSARFISGFSTMSQEERAKYDQEKMSKDMALFFLQLTLIAVCGGICSLWEQKVVILFGILWLFRFFREVHLDQEKAFGKYRKE